MIPASLLLSDISTPCNIPTISELPSSVSLPSYYILKTPFAGADPEF